MIEDQLVEAIRARTPDEHLMLVASPEEVAALEAEIGFRMPPFLRRLYTEVSNGGFGIDGWPMLSLPPAANWAGNFSDVLDAYRAFTSLTGDPEGDVVPAGMVPLLDRGCSMWTLADFRTPEGRIWDWDANEECCWLAPTTIASVRQLFADDLAGRLDSNGPRRDQRLHVETCAENPVR